MSRPQILQTIIVEGKYDKIKLESIVDALIIPTDGFRIFKDKEMRTLIKKLANETGIVILTDSDGAGFIIRRHLMGLIPSEQITNVYIPDCIGKESRKAKPSKEGKLGVEGMETQVLLDALEKAGLLGNCDITTRQPITKMDMYDAGLSGRDDSKLLRKKLIKHLKLPARLSAGALPTVLSRLISREEFFSLCLQLKDDCIPTKKQL